MIKLFESFSLERFTVRADTTAKCILCCKVDKDCRLFHNDDFIIDGSCITVGRKKTIDMNKAKKQT